MSKVKQQPAVPVRAAGYRPAKERTGWLKGDLLSSADLSMNNLTMEAATKMVGKSEAHTDVSGTHSTM